MMTKKIFDLKEDFLSNLQNTHDFCPEDCSFSESRNFLQKIMSNINETRLKKETDKNKGEIMKALSLSDSLFNNENQLKNFEKMFNGLRRTKDDIMNSYAAFKEFEGNDYILIDKIIEFLNTFLNGTSIKQLENFLNKIQERKINFPIFMRELVDFFEIDFSQENDFFQENDRKILFPEINFLTEEKKFENYKYFFFLLKVVENSLIFLNNDFQYSNVIGHYNKKRNGEGNGDKRILEDSFLNSIYKFRKYYINTVFGRKTVQFDGKTIEFGVDLETNVRFKSIVSLINKGLLGGYDPNSIHDLFGCLFHIKLPELEQEYKKEPKKEKLKNIIKEEKYNVLKDIISFIPSLIKNNRSMDIRTRDYLKEDKDNKSSGENYKAIHITFSKFQLNHYEFPIPIECKIMMEDSPHNDYKERQNNEIVNNFFLKYNIKDFWGYLILYYLLLEKGNYNFNMFKFSDDIVEEIKTKEKILSENRERIYNLILESFCNMDKELFEKIIQNDLVETTFVNFSSKKRSKKKKNKKPGKEEKNFLSDLTNSFYKNILKELKKYFEENCESDSIKDCQEKLEILQKLVD